jgi:hypothetical protein
MAVKEKSVTCEAKAWSLPLEWGPFICCNGKSLLRVEVRGSDKRSSLPQNRINCYRKGFCNTGPWTRLLD